jgi:23S rRNA (uracil1939-C5)-methyltransferase
MVALQVKRLVYVSCGFEALKRDATALMAAGWKVTHAEGFVLFPGSDHLETLAVFDR